MTKVTLISVVNSNNYPHKKVQNILKNTIYDFEIIFINNNSSEISADLYKLSLDDSRVIVKELQNDNLMQTLNTAIVESRGKFIIFTNSLSILKNDTLKRAYNKLDDSEADMLMFDQHTDVTTVISRIVGDKTFNYHKISEYLFSINVSLNNFIYEKGFLINNNLSFNPKKHDDILVFSYRCIIKANKIVYFNKQLIPQKNKRNYSNYFSNYLDNLKEIQDLFYLENNQQLLHQVNNYRISKSAEKYDDINISSKKEAFNILRNNFIKLLESKNSDVYLNTLSNANRKSFEQVIISETVEEYELLRKVSQDKNHINYMKRYEKILKVEQKKISDFNKSLISSNSWKLTKFLRLGKKM